MFTNTLRAVGGSVMFAVPKPFLEALNLKANMPLNLRLEGNEIVLSAPKPKGYSLEELMAQCDVFKAPSHEEQEWLDSSPVGEELI